MEASALAPRGQSVQTSQASARTSQKLEVSYTDPNGQAFHLELERKTELHAATYDASGSLLRGGEGRSQTPGLRQEPIDLAHALQDSGEAVRGFRQLLHRMLKASDPAYAGRFAAFDPLETDQAGVRAEATTVSETVTLSMDTVDPEYWSVENTAGRLEDFALALYAGGDRNAHVEKMVAAMEQGYGQARDAFGGSLPDVARQTLERAKEMLADWASQTQATDAAAAEPASLDMVA
jgi:hypothetical protein